MDLSLVADKQAALERLQYRAWEDKHLLQASRIISNTQYKDSKTSNSNDRLAASDDSVQPGLDYTSCSDQNCVFLFCFVSQSDQIVWKPCWNYWILTKILGSYIFCKRQALLDESNGQSITITPTASCMPQLESICSKINLNNSRFQASLPLERKPAVLLPALPRTCTSCTGSMRLLEWKQRHKKSTYVFFFTSGRPDIVYS